MLGNWPQQVSRILHRVNSEEIDGRETDSSHSRSPPMSSLPTWRFGRLCSLMPWVRASSIILSIAKK